MCKVQDKYTEAKQFTGYKVALKDKKTGKYYSPSTGTIYREGRRMRPLKSKVQGFNINMFVGLANPFQKRFYDQRMQGKTGVFVSKGDAKGLLVNMAISLKYSVEGKAYKAVLLEMTIKGGLHHAVLDTTCPTIVGSHIVAMKELK